MVGFPFFWLEILTSLSSLEHKTIHQLHWLSAVSLLLSPGNFPSFLMAWWVGILASNQLGSCCHCTLQSQQGCSLSLSQVLRCQLTLSSISERSWKKSQINRRITAYWGWRRLNFCLAGHLFMGSFSILNWFQSRIMWSSSACKWQPHAQDKGKKDTVGAISPALLLQRSYHPLPFPVADVQILKLLQLDKLQCR